VIWPPDCAAAGVGAPAWNHEARKKTVKKRDDRAGARP